MPTVRSVDVEGVVVIFYYKTGLPHSGTVIPSWAEHIISILTFAHVEPFAAGVAEVRAAEAVFVVSRAHLKRIG